MIGRRWAKALGRLERRLTPRAPVILIYHRINDCESDFWALNTPAARFREQIAALQSVRQVVPLGELAGRADRARATDRPLAAVTFDDGYYDIYRTARPILEQLDCPATVFVASGMVDAEREFWWDELALIFIETPRLPTMLELRFGGRPRRWTLPEGDVAARRRVCSRVWRRLQDLAPEAVEAQLSAIRAWAGLQRPARRSHRAMSSCELGKLAGGPVSVGAHTVSHPSLPALNRERLRAEVTDSRRTLEAMVPGPVTQFAFPYGHYNARSVAAVREAGFTSACTIVPNVVSRHCDPLRLPRISPGLADGEAMLRALA